MRISSREPTPRDRKTGLFYAHLRGLAGTVRKVYGGDEVAVDIDPDALPEDVWKRHMSARDEMRERWLASLPDEARRKLPPEQRDFALRYVVLVAAGDVRRVQRPRSRRAEG